MVKVYPAVCHTVVFTSFLGLTDDPRRRRKRKMVLIAVEAVPAGSKPPAADNIMRIFMG